MRTRVAIPPSCKFECPAISFDFILSISFGPATPLLYPRVSSTSATTCLTSYRILKRNIKGTASRINTLANWLNELQYAGRFIALLYPIESQWESTPQCDIKIIVTAGGRRRKQDANTLIYTANTPFLIPWYSPSHVWDTIFQWIMKFINLFK